MGHLPRQPSEVLQQDPSAGSADRVLADVRASAFRAVRLFGTALGLPNMVMALAAAAATNRLGVMTVVNAAVLFAAIAGGWLFTDRSSRAGIAALTALVALLGLTTLWAWGLTPGAAALVVLTCGAFAVFYGRLAAGAAWVGWAAMLAVHGAWTSLAEGPSSTPAGMAQVPGLVYLRYALATMAVAGIVAAMAIAVVRGLVDSTRALAASLQREVQEREQRLAGERALAHGRHLEALGRLAGGVAHDTNNALTSIRGCIAELLEKPDRPPDPAILADMDRAMKGAAETIRQLVALGRATGRHRLVPAPVEPGPIVEQFARAFRRLVPEGVEVRLEVRATSAVLVDAGLLEQALLNLGLNARDALADGGAIDFRIHDMERSGRTWVAIEVVDDGPGLAPEVRAHLFEPYFTTKAEGKGTGLGLAQVYSFAAAAGGSVEVESEPGRGAVFRLLLPPLARGAGAG